MKFRILFLVSLFTSSSYSINLDYNKCLQLIRLPMIIYDYRKTITYNTTDEIDPKSSSDVLTLLKRTAPNGKVITFIDDERNGLQTGITKSSKQKRICIVFRGSEELNDWYYNLMIQKVHLKDGIRVHEGFLKQLNSNNNYRKIADILSHEISKHPDYEIFVLGHSLGASLSTLFGYQFSKESSSLINVVSFASPRVGNLNFKKDFEKQSNLVHYRITNKRDIVPALPIVNYHHVGEHIHMDGKSFEIKGGNNLFTSWSVKDHDISSYYKSMKDGYGWNKM